ncbi:MAG: hypothetical protein EAZ92_15505 [Candidatus Kapaibacterium sp.]|nr:MAG: hypothetical protein EAZ92_15505 [Candidatus Kapabacteria bacterium]
MRTANRDTAYRIADTAWSLCIVVGITMGAVYIPLRLVRNIDQSIFSYTIAMTVTLVFMLDVAYNVWVTLRSHAHDEVNRFAALKSYARRRLWIDVIAALPLTMLHGIDPHLILFRLIKMVRLRDIFLWWQRATIRYSTHLRLIFLLYWMVMTAHWCACGWISIHGAPTGVPFRDYYIRSFYWAVTTLSTVGYGDVTPKSNMEVLYATGVMGLGVIMYGYVIGNIANILRNLDMNRQRYYEHTELVRSFMSSRKIPKPLQRRIGEYYAYFWERQLGHDESHILSDLPPSLRTEVSIFLRRDIIQKAPIFCKTDTAFIQDLAQQLRSALFPPGDVVFRYGEEGDKMYFVAHGRLEVVNRHEEVVAILEEGDIFGEVALLLQQPRSATVRAVEYCDVYVLDNNAFQAALMRHPRFGEKLRLLALERQERADKE